MKKGFLCTPAVGNVADVALDHLVSIRLKQGTDPVNVAWAIVFSDNFDLLKA